jgi:hypothetical protein
MENVIKDLETRMQAAVNHRKWVDIAAYLGCFAIRCNCTGTGIARVQDCRFFEASECDGEPSFHGHVYASGQSGSGKAVR